MSAPMSSLRVLVAARAASADAALGRARDVGRATVADVTRLHGDVTWLAGEVERLSVQVAELERVAAMAGESR